MIVYCHCGILWYTMVHCDILWYTVVYCGTLWYTVVHCGILWYTVVHCGILWYTVVYCGILWYTVVHYGILWYTVVYCDTLWVMTLCNTSSKQTENEQWAKKSGYCTTILRGKEDRGLWSISTVKHFASSLHQWGIQVSLFASVLRSCWDFAHPGKNHLLHSGFHIVSSPDLIRRVYRFQYNARYWKRSALGLVLGLGPRLGFIQRGGAEIPPPPPLPLQKSWNWVWLLLFCHRY